MIEMNELLDLIRREVMATMYREHERKLTVTSYDPQTHSVKGTLQPSGVESGWIPVGCVSSGNGYGVVVGPCVGDQMDVKFENGDPNSPLACHRLFSTNATPPSVESGEVGIVSKFNHSIKLTKDGKTSITTQGDVTASTTGKLNVSAQGDTSITTQGKASIQAQGDTSVNSSGKLNIRSSGACSMTASEFDVTGDFKVTGNITATENVTAGGGSVDLLSHIHGGVTSGAAETLPPTG